MSSQNLFLDQRMKGKESFPYTVPWREGLTRVVKVGVLSICAVGSVLPAVGLAATIQGTETASPVAVQVPKEVQQALQGHGEVRVIIGLKVSFKPEGELATQEEVVKQQANIAQAQGEFLNWLKSKSSLPIGEKVFATIPHVAISVTKETLQLVVQHPLVKDIGIDETTSLSNSNNSVEVIQ
ncbi:MAG: hypothetical protein BWK78_04730 [Thiotrichaceae bacterium IS1]|nr:MAG: hypothetical protein BWK78_04730 [Thiotrichaceae bacterium IS1]